MSLHKWLQRREYGMRQQFGDSDYIMKRIYTSLEPYKSWNDLDLIQAISSEYGAVYNLEFSSDGNILAAACEKKAIILFDAVSQKQTERIMDAHTDSVNCIKFLDNRSFATCSDDTTVALWDLRFLKKKIRSLHGHSNWVKNIEYSNKDGLLVTSGFDGSIFTWDINSYTEEGLVYQKVFTTSGLMRCRISPDCTKLVLCTTNGFLMIIHNLDLTTLHKDLCGFKPNVYRLMQMGDQYIPQAAKYDYIFSKKMKKNRVELVTDFSEENDAEVISALQIHPHGHSFLSRNISYDEKSEWSCIHDLNEETYDITVRRPDKRKRKLNDDDEINAPSTSSGKKSTTISNNTSDVQTNHQNPDSVNFPCTSTEARRNLTPLRRRLFNISAATTINNSQVILGNGSTTPTMNPMSTPARSSRTTHPEFVADIWAAEITIQERAARQARGGRQTNSVSGYDFVYAISSGILPMMSEAESSISNDDTIVPYKDRHILQNAKKLMYYIKESNKGKGFIKEPSFSSDGRIICSPFSCSVRLLSYSEDCSEHPAVCVREKLKKSPKQLAVVKTIHCEKDIVLSTAFSPTQPLLVTGCRFGKVTWHCPNL